MEDNTDLLGMRLICATYSNKAIVLKLGDGPLRGSFIQDIPSKERIKLPKGTILTDAKKRILNTTTERGFKLGV